MQEARGGGHRADTVREMCVLGGRGGWGRQVAFQTERISTRQTLNWCCISFSLFFLPVLPVHLPSILSTPGQEQKRRMGSDRGEREFAGEAVGEHPSMPARLRACVSAPGSPRRAVLRGAGRQPRRRGGSPQGQRRQRWLPGLAGLQRQRPDAPLPHRLHPRADRPAGEGVLPGELRVQAPEM